MPVFPGIALCLKRSFHRQPFRVLVKSAAGRITTDDCTGTMDVFPLWRMRLCVYASYAILGRDRGALQQPYIRPDGGLFPQASIKDASGAAKCAADRPPDQGRPGRLQLP